MLVGEPYWRREPPDQATLEGCYGTGKEDWLPLPELIESFGLLGCDVVEMVLTEIRHWGMGRQVRSSGAYPPLGRVGHDAIPFGFR